MNNNYWVLINKDVDGEITADEKSILEKELNNNADLKEYAAELKNVVRKLNDESRTSYEIDISEEVMNSINQTERLKAVQEKTKLAAIFALFSMSRVRYASVFGLGVIVCFIFLSLFNNNNLNPGNISGSMIDADTYPNFENAGNIVIDIPELDGKVNTQVYDDKVLVKVDLASKNEIKLNFNFDETRLQVYAVKPIKQNNQSSFVSANNLVQINNKGGNSYLLMFRNNLSGEKISLKIFSDQNEIYNNLILTQK
jgi:hypothetical protein